MAPKLKIFKVIGLLALWALLTLWALNVFYGNQNNYSLHSSLKYFSNFGSNNKWKLHVDDEIEDLSNADRLQRLKQELPNLPFDYWDRNKLHKLQLNNSCAYHPSHLKLAFHNTYWQTFTNAGKTFRLYAAYLDDRPSVIDQQGRVVRILGMIDTIDQPFVQNYCQMWFDSAPKVSIVPVVDYKLLWHLKWGTKKDQYYSYLMTCVVPKERRSEIPQAVSLVARQCDSPTNSLRVIYEKPNGTHPRQPVAVCVKGLDFPNSDLSARMVEWMELMRLLGVHKVYMYNLSVHSNLTKVLDYYVRDGFLDVTPITMATGEPQLAIYQHLALTSNKHNKRMNELIPYNDCFYRHMYQYDYIALLDIDEVILPMGNLTSWHDLIGVMKSMQKENIAKCPSGYASYCFRQVHFPAFQKDLNRSQSDSLVDDIPQYQYMLRHIWRHNEISKIGMATKCMHNTSDVLTLHNHYSLSWLKSCGPKTIDASLGRMQHYRSQLPQKPLSREELLTDSNIWRFKEELIAASERVLKALGFLRPG